MGAICILTDNTAQFPKVTFPGQELVRLVSLDIRLNPQYYPQTKSIKSIQLPSIADSKLSPALIPPSSSYLSELFSTLLKEFDEIIGIFLSSSINNLVLNAKKAAHISPARNRIHIIDSNCISSGLGFLVENASSIAINNGSTIDIEQMVREYIPRIYSLFFIPSVSYLSFAGLVENAQALVSDFLGILPIYSLEEGKLLPVQKVKNFRGLYDVFQEFLDEFDDLKMVTLLQNGIKAPIEERMFRQYCKERFRNSNFFELPISLPQAVLFGPQSLGLVVVENPE
jgi:DegV family protein with EDD domain